ncbi:PAS domain-containing protein [Pontibacillus salipaludis]|uniref:PAS domain-containing protein n=1 Tax=Pontibacillus salipaludis TaxID=1697394 RepID=UPI0031EF83CB
MNQLSNQMMNHLSFGILAIDTEYRITALNEVGARLLQINQEEAIGQNVYDLFPDAPEDIRHIERTAKTGEEVELDAMPYQWGKYRLYLSLKTKVLKEGNEKMGALAEFQDVTAYHEKQLELVKNMEDMSVTIIPVTNQIALFPLQPVIDNLEFHYILDKGVENISKMNVHDLILDFSAIRSVDLEFLNKIEKLMETVKLIGINVTLTGIQPAVAKEWSTGYDKPSDIAIYSTLQNAVEAIYTKPMRS